MNANDNNLNWFEIPVSDFPRAKTFYESTFNIKMYELSMGEYLMAMFPATPGNGKANGALVKSDMHKPSMDGTIVYLNGNPDLDEALGRVEEAGGKVLMPKTLIGEGNGFMAFFSDSEGNRIGLHSMA